MAATFPPERSGPSQQRSRTVDVIEHRIDSDIYALRRWRQKRKTLHTSLQSTNVRKPYHEYVHRLVAAGWENLQDLDTYLNNAPSKQSGIIVSVVDIKDDFSKTHWPDIQSEHELMEFVDGSNREGVKVRFYVAEYENTPATCIIESLGSALRLDPRFFSWSIGSKGHVFTPSQRHRAPYIVLEFGVLSPTTNEKTAAEKFKVLIYIQPDREGDGWTAIILFSSHTKVDLSPRIITDPPLFGFQLPPPRRLESKSYRELYLQSFEFVDIEKAVISPFYAVSNLLRLNTFCWNQVITAIREEDYRVKGISDTTIGHSEEIRKSLSIVERGGSLGWRGRDEAKTKEVQEALLEDLKHLVDQTDLMWKNRERMASVKRKDSDARWTTLTNAFTYVFAPVTIISGIYGMNVSQISGDSSNPNIWQFFVAVAGFNFVVIAVFALSKWVQILFSHGRNAGVKEVVGFAVGKG